MRILYLCMIAILLGSFWRALVKLRHNELALTPILGWVLGLAFFILAPLTLIVVHGGYSIPSFYEVNDSYSHVDLSTGEFRIPINIVCCLLLEKNMSDFFS